MIEWNLEATLDALPCDLPVPVRALLRGEPRSVEAQLGRASVKGVRRPDEVAGSIERSHVVEDRRQRHPKRVRHLRRRQWAPLEKQAVDRVLVGTHAGPGERVGEHPAQALRRDEEVEKERDLSPTQPCCDYID